MKTQQKLISNTKIFSSHMQELTQNLIKNSELQHYEASLLLNLEFNREYRKAFGKRMCNELNKGVMNKSYGTTDFMTFEQSTKKEKIDL